jgi:hypothetical protein
VFEQQRAVERELQELADEEAARYKAKVKINGRTEEKTLKEIIDGYRVNTAAEERFRTAAEERKRAQELYESHKQEREAAKGLLSLIESLKESPKTALQFLQETGVDLNALVSDYIGEQTRLSQMSPEERRIMELQERLEGFEKKEELSKKEMQEREQEAMRRQVDAAIQNELGDSIERIEGMSLKELSALDADDPRRRNVYLSLERALQIGLYQLNSKGQFQSFDALYKRGKGFVDSLTESGKRAAVQELASGKAPIPKELSKAVREHDIKTLRAPHAPRRSAPSEPSKPKNQPTTIDSAFESIQKKLQR